ncbi:MAG: hypothetical protein ACLSUR_17195, partial [Coprobacillus cateniformis]
MGINWEILIKKFGLNEATTKFEQLSLYYVQDTYREYNWILTQETHDNNRDIHLKEYEDYEKKKSEDKPDFSDKWAEAKYKKNSVSLRKKDLDPTILSGLIDGEVELIIFITNGNIPTSLLYRNMIGADIKNIKISYVIGRQLEDWLYLNPQIYFKIFEEKLTINGIKKDCI